jgi:prepilin signal peptidase PulO-like enzyme (type II secretory pathway)
MLYFVFVVVFLIGIAVGSFLNVCAYRLPFEKSVLWPGLRGDFLLTLLLDRVGHRSGVRRVVLSRSRP